MEERFYSDGANIPVEPERAGEGSKKTDPNRAVGLDGGPWRKSKGHRY